jgi:DNA-binding CsgD family transcriptional regulator
MAHLTREGARRIRLEPLPAPVTAAVVADVVGAPPGPGLLALAGQATGNPLALMELLRGLREENRLHLADGLVRVGGDALPRRLTGHVHQRLSRLGSEARRMMLVAAVLPRRFTAAQLAGLLQCRPTALVETLDELLRADLVVSEADHLRFHHELLRRAVLDIMPSSLRQALEHEATSPASPPAPARAATRRPVAGWAGLTESERRVVDLVAAGATNREAARQLYLSPHTVGTHIRHAFEKLGINSRVQLANMMRDNAA